MNLYDMEHKLKDKTMVGIVLKSSSYRFIVWHVLVEARANGGMNHIAPR